MEEFLTKKLNNHEIANYLVFGTSVNSPLYRLDDIKRKLDLRDGDKVLFDQLLQVGNHENRFIMISFQNGNFEYNSTIQLPNNKISKNIKKEISSFLKNNRDILKFSILLSTEKQDILQGRII